MLSFEIFLLKQSFVKSYDLILYIRSIDVKIFIKYVLQHSMEHSILNNVYWYKDTDNCTNELIGQCLSVKQIQHNRRHKLTDKYRRFHIRSLYSFVSVSNVFPFDSR